MCALFEFLFLFISFHFGSFRFHSFEPLKLLFFVLLVVVSPRKHFFIWFKRIHTYTIDCVRYTQEIEKEGKKKQTKKEEEEEEGEKITQK